MWLTFCRRGKVAAAAAVATTEPTQSAEKNPKMMKRRKLLFLLLLFLLLLTTTTGQPLMIVEDLEEDWDRLDEAENVRVRRRIEKRGEKCEYSFDLI